MDGKIQIDKDTCRHCGRCVGKCLFHTIEDGTYGYKIYIGGRWGKKVSKGRSLSKIFTSKDEALDVIERQSFSSVITASRENASQKPSSESDLKM